MTLAEESRIHIYFITGDRNAETFKAVAELIEDKGLLRERVDDRTLRLTGYLSHCNLWYPEQHDHPYSAEICRLSIKVENLVPPDKREQILDIVFEVYDLTDASYVFGHHEFHEDGFYVLPDEEPASSPITGESLSANRIEYPTLLMLFPPAMVEEYGSDWLRDLPVARIEEGDDGSLLVMPIEDTSGWTDDQAILDALADGLEPLHEAFEDRHAQM